MKRRKGTKQKLPTRVTTREETFALMDQAITPHARALAPILLSGKIAVVVFEPSDRKAILNLGWDGISPVFQLRDEIAERMAQALPQDPVTRRWLRSGAQGRIFLFMHHGSLLVNFVAGKGYSIEPGSTDAENVN